MNADEHVQTMKTEMMPCFVRTCWSCCLLETNWHSRGGPNHWTKLVVAGRCLSGDKHACNELWLALFVLYLLGIADGDEREYQTEK